MESEASSRGIGGPDKVKDMRKIKQHALERLPGTPFSMAVQSLPDYVSEREFSSLIPILFALLKLESEE